MLPKTKTKDLAEEVGFLAEEKSAWEKSRPSIIEINDWLRETHNIHCMVIPDNDLSFTYYKGKVVDFERDLKMTILSNNEQDYYETLEDCVISGLLILKANGEKTEK